ncbi:MAG: N-acetyltransferase [Oscillospiraceae bacterium]|nr:N-acetyltransferase [Oscillospiraceae bacterium]
MSDFIIRNETEKDYKTVEKIVRDAFWDVNFPGCDEHYLAHILRGHKDFIPELDLVAELDGQVIGNIMYTKAALIGANGEEKEILTFGPVCIAPEFQRMGYGKKLIEYSFERAAEAGYEAVVIFGHPSNYISLGFKSCKKYNVSVDNDVYPCAMLVKELKQGALSGGKWVYRESPAYNFDEKDAEEFDKQFERREKGYRQSQEEFYIYSHSVIK